jgi:LysM repeat protein
MYDTGDPYGSPDASMGQGASFNNPVYDSPAAYEENIADGSSSFDQAPTNSNAIIHTVVKGDTLSGLSHRYKVPMESIMQANGMTNDIVILGRKMVIPPR